MENLRKRINVILVNSEKDFLKYTSSSTHITHKTFDKNFAAIHEIKPVLTLNKPIYVGFTVPKLSKWLMYDFHCNFVKKHFDAELLFTDTDSLTYEIKSEDVCEERFKHKQLFDFSNYPKDSKFFHEANKKVIHKMKDVSEEKIINEFVGLKSKIHSMKNINGKEANTAKGVNVAAEFKELKDTLFNKKIMRHKMRRFQAKKHNVGTYEIEKISLSVFDDRQSVSNNGVDTLAYFHKDLIYVNNPSIFFQECSKCCSLSALHNLPYIIWLVGEVYGTNKKRSKKFSQMMTNKNKCVQIKNILTNDDK